MRIVSIFEKVHPKLFSALFDDQDELLVGFDDGYKPSASKDEMVKAFEKWKDVFWLRHFFMTFRVDLMLYDPSMTVKRAIRETRDEADKFYDELLAVSGAAEQLSKLFKPLDNREVDGFPYEFQKLKGKRRWLRLYALKYDDYYVITGGAIKLTKGMKERPHLKHELVKLDYTRVFLDSADSSGSFVYLDVI